MKKKLTTHDHRPFTFPKNFLWGASTSSHQVEGNNTLNDWYEWEKQGNIANKEISGLGPNHYEKYEEDFDIAQEMNHSIHRLSIEWSRIEPKMGFWNTKEIEHYKNVCKALKKRKIKIMLTLHHFTNPQWVSNYDGWTNSGIKDRFEQYVKFVLKHLHQYVDFWVTINEPMVYLSQSYISGEWTPGYKNDYWSAYKVLRNMIAVHKTAYQTIHEFYKNKRKKPVVGIAKNVISFETLEKTSLFDVMIPYFARQYWNHYFMKKTRGYHDFIGVNYYFHKRFSREKGSLLSKIIEPDTSRRHKSDIGWEIYPVGIFNALVEMKKYNLPIYITENGLATNNDHKRVRFIIEHLLQVHHAIEIGVNVKGYCHWSLLDNFEWHLGYAPRFGLVEVNYKNQKRIIRKSGKIYGEICKKNAIHHDLLRYIGHGIE